MSLVAGSQGIYQNPTGRSMHGSQRGQQQADWRSVDKALILKFSEIMRAILGYQAQNG